VSYYLGDSRPGFGLIFFLALQGGPEIYLPVVTANGFFYFRTAAAMRSKVQTGWEQRIGKTATLPQWEYKP
jgi:hypothetical protein